MSGSGSPTRRGAVVLAAGFPLLARAEAPNADTVRALAPRGRLRTAINLGNPVLARREAGALAGVSVDLAHRLAERLGTGLDLVAYEGAGAVSDAAGADTWDIAFLAIDPVRAAGIAFTAPYLVIEGTYLVRKDASYARIEDVDRAGTRVAIGRGSAYDLFLTRAIRNAVLLRLLTSAEAVAAFARDGLEVAAGVRQPLEHYAQAHPGYRVLPGRFMAIEQAMGVPRERADGISFLRRFVEDAKASGFVAEAIARHGQPDARVAPPADRG